MSNQNYGNQQGQQNYADQSQGTNRNSHNSMENAPGSQGYQNQNDRHPQNNQGGQQQGQAPMGMAFNQDQANKAGGPEGLTRGGDHIVTLNEGKHINAKTGAQGIEFSGVTSEGKVNYLSVYYQKGRDKGNVVNESGNNTIQAIMGFCGLTQGVQPVQRGNEYFYPEFAGKVVGLFLQKKLRTKTGGGDSYEFNISVAFDSQTMATMKEISDGADATLIRQMAENYQDIDERGKNPQSNQAGQGGQGNGVPADYDQNSGPVY